MVVVGWLCLRLVFNSVVHGCYTFVAGLFVLSFSRLCLGGWVVTWFGYLLFDLVVVDLV